MKNKKKKNKRKYNKRGKKYFINIFSKKFSDINIEEYFPKTVKIKII